MIDMQNTKSAIMLVPQSIGTTAVSGYVDTLGYDHARIMYIGDTAASGDVLTVLKLSEGDTTSAFTDITGGAPGTIPVPNTSTGDITIFDVNLNKPRKRYIALNITGDATARLTSAVAILSRAAQAPDTDALAGAAKIVYI
jgi:hypothetical protein